MIGNFLIYIASVSEVCCYSVDAFNTYEIYSTLKSQEKRVENRKVNAFSIKIRLCVILSNTCFLSYNAINQLSIPATGYALFFALDIILLATRMWYEYVFYSNPLENTVITITNAIHLQSGAVP